MKEEIKLYLRANIENEKEIGTIRNAILLFRKNTMLIREKISKEDKSSLGLVNNMANFLENSVNTTMTNYVESKTEI